MYKKMKLAGIISAVLLSGTVYSADMTVGFSQIGSESGWRAAETSVAKTEAEKRGITLKIADAQQKQENQIKAIRSFIAQGVDAIFIAPVVQTGWEPVLQEAKEADIPVFLLDRNITVKDDSLFMTGVAADSVHEGAVAADWLVRQLDGKACNVVELQGTVGASVALDRKKASSIPWPKYPPSRSSGPNQATLLAARAKRSWRALSRPRIMARIFAPSMPITTTWPSVPFRRLKRPD